MVDLRLMRIRKNRFVDSQQSKNLYAHMLNRQLFEIKVLVPAALAFNFAAFLLIARFGNIFIDRQWHIALVAAQTIFAILVLIDSARNFKKRAALIGNTIEG